MERHGATLLVRTLAHSLCSSKTRFASYCKQSVDPNAHSRIKRLYQVVPGASANMTPSIRLPCFCSVYCQPHACSQCQPRPCYAGQIFFSLSATLGIMSAYGSYAPMTTNIYADGSMVAAADTTTSIFAGFAVRCS